MSDLLLGTACSLLRRDYLRKIAMSRVIPVAWAACPDLLARSWREGGEAMAPWSPGHPTFVRKLDVLFLTRFPRHS